MKNKLILIGWMGVKRAYLNIPREEAIARFLRSEDMDEPLDPALVREFDFDDEFGVYDAWAPND